jgi:hypothetical protein
LQEIKLVAERYLKETYADDMDDIIEQTSTIFAYRELKAEPFGLHVKHNGTASESLPKLTIYKNKKEILVYDGDITDQEAVVEWIHTKLGTSPVIIAKQPVEVSEYDEL